MCESFDPSPSKLPECQWKNPSVRTTGSSSHPCSPAGFSAPKQLNRAKTKHRMKTLTVHLIEAGRGLERGEEEKSKMKGREREGRRGRERGEGREVRGEQKTAR